MCQAPGAIKKLMHEMMFRPLRDDHALRVDSGLARMDSGFGVFERTYTQLRAHSEQAAHHP